MKPNARKGRTGHLKQCIARTFLAIALVTSSVPVSPRPATAIDDAANARIASMLATGEFVEGEAVAIVRQGAMVEAAVQTEELAKVDAGTVEETARAGAAESAADGETALRAQAAGDERLEGGSSWATDAPPSSSCATFTPTQTSYPPSRTT